jgi:hypothetical protein
VNLNVNSLTAAVGQAVAIAALAAAVIVVCKAAGVGLPVRGSLLDWTYVAVACAAAKLAR